MENFINTLESKEGVEALELGNKIKKLDRDTDKKLKGVTLLSMISMTVLGYFAFGIYGAMIFFAITAVSSFALVLSSKKNMLLKYLAFYRSKIPELIALSNGISVKAEEAPDAEFVSSLYPSASLAYRMCHSYDGLYIGYAKFMRGNEVLLQGLLYFTSATADDENAANAVTEIFNERFGECTIKVDEGKALAFIPGVDDYLNGRVEMKDDLTRESLCRQYGFYELGKQFGKTINM